ncbi:MAG: DUF1285 domain-containing protein [Pseudomonadota bacterium]
MTESLQRLVDTIVAATTGLPTPAVLSAWQPELSGTLDIRIRDNGSWEHEGDAIAREGLLRLFASLLRREADGEYYLVTPAEKWRIRVDRHALQGIDCDTDGYNGSAIWYVLLNTGGRCRIGGENKLHPVGDAGEPFALLPNGLSAQITRPAWYRLIEAASIEDDCAFIISGGERIELGRVD